MKTAKLIISTFSIMFMAIHVQAQGGLAPTAAPAPTMKTLQQVEPRIDLATVSGDASYHHVITNSGSYYLSNNLGVTLANGISISVAGVTLDLNGFEISRASGSGVRGISIASGGDRVTVRNGTIVGFQYGIQDDTYSKSCLYEKLAVSGCTSYGMFTGTASRIIDCRAHGNPGTGIISGSGASLDGCTASNNGGDGIYVGSGSSLNGCTADKNQGSYGIRAGNGSSLANCSAYDNEATGIRAGNGSSLANCSASSNKSTGIYTPGGSSLDGCTASGNNGAYGIYAGIVSSLRGCTARDNYSSASSSYGIYAGSGSTVVECSAYSNSHTNSPGTSVQGLGIYVGFGSTVKDCTAGYNEGDGIRIDGSCAASGNTCYYNGYFGDGAGIYAFSRNRIIGNHVSNNDRGIEVVSFKNTLGGNTAVDNSTNNYVIATGNSYGDIVDNTGDGGSAPAHSGNGAAGGTISANNNPWANFSL
jgi:parallel beta-helix repeat protein